MATAKRERQKAARRQKMEQMQREAKRRRTIRRSVIVGVVAIAIVVSAAYLFSGSSTPTTTTTAAGATTTTTKTSATTTTAASSATTTPSSFAPVSSPSPAGKFGTAPTVIVPAGNPPTSMEVSNLIEGAGKPAMIGSKLTVQYVLATYSSRKVVQSSWTSSPFSFTLGAGQVIAGWDEGLVGMHVGGRRELIIPPSLGYHNQAQGPGIAANDTLVFVVDLLKVS